MLLSELIFLVVVILSQEEIKPQDPYLKFWLMVVLTVVY